jgi:hypothetical protein
VAVASRRVGRREANPLTFAASSPLHYATHLAERFGARVVW